MLNFKLETRRLDSSQELPRWVSGVVVGAVATLLLACELRRALRQRQREPKMMRSVRNLVIAAGAGAVMQIAERPVSLYVARQVSRRQWGLAPLLAQNQMAQIVISVAALDYGLYIWHVLTHRVPWLWRFHLVHHIDLDMDASTALRFHFGEMALSVPWRAAQIAIAGASPLSVSIWQTLLLASILFHHSNVRLPKKFERLLSLLLMTPRLHAIHHQAVYKETNSNWSSGLAVWDLLHGTWRGSANDAPLGVPAYQKTEDVTFAKCAVLPFRTQKADWVPESQPARVHVA